MKPPENKKCMISKTDIKASDSVLQCPECLNYFLMDYLLDWLNEHDICPVCKRNLKTQI